MVNFIFRSQVLVTALGPTFTPNFGVVTVVPIRVRFGSALPHLPPTGSNFLLPRLRIDLRDFCPVFVQYVGALLFRRPGTVFFDCPGRQHDVGVGVTILFVMN